MDNDPSEAKELISSIGSLSENGFSHFLYYCLKDLYGKDLEQSNSTRAAWYTINRDSEMYAGLSHFLFMTDYLPYDVCLNPRDIPFDNSFLRRRIQIAMAEMDRKELYSLLQAGRHLVVGSAPCTLCLYINTICDNHEEMKEVAFSQLVNMVQSMQIDKIGHGVARGFQIGSPYSIVENTPRVVPDALRYAQSKDTNISIEYSDKGYEVNCFRQDKYITTGVGRISKDLIFPTVIERTPNSICLEFEKLLNSEPSEKMISDFIYDNYARIFGERYDAIQSEVGLRFPELDISGKNRRIDLMIHDSIQNDWEIIELKKQMPIVKPYRDVPSFTSDIIGAINQLRNYHDILLQQKVRDHFLREGIEYYYPAMKLIVGGKPNITHAQWRKLVSNIQDVQLLTYDFLIKEMKTRYHIDESI